MCPRGIPIQTPSIIFKFLPAHCTHPIAHIQPIAHITVKCRIRPIGGVLHIPVFDRVVVDVIGMTGKIVFIADLMLPESPLPDRRFTMLEF